MKPPEKIKLLLIQLLKIAAVIAAVFYIDNQTYEHRDFLTLVVIILYIVWLGQQRLDKLSKEKCYACIFEKDIIEVDGDDAIVTLKIEHSLPFIPFPGLSVADNNNPPTESIVDCDKYDYTQFHTGNIISVSWRYSKFVCKVKPHQMTPQNILGKVIATHYEHAWRVDLMWPEIRDALETYLVEQEKELATAKPDAEIKRHQLEQLRKSLKR